ncbi:hypothetical protein [Achromobacter kerstersii]
MGEISRLRGTPRWDDKKPEWNFWPYCRRLGGSPCSGLRQRWPALNRPRLGFGRNHCFGLGDCLGHCFGHCFGIGGCLGHRFGPGPDIAPNETVPHETAPD